MKYSAAERGIRLQAHWNRKKRGSHWAVVVGVARMERCEIPDPVSAHSALIRDPGLRFAPSGLRMATHDAASEERQYDTDRRKWPGPGHFLDTSTVASIAAFEVPDENFVALALPHRDV